MLQTKQREKLRKEKAAFHERETALLYVLLKPSIQKAE